jgi:hypothetical protein
MRLRKFFNQRLSILGRSLVIFVALFAGIADTAHAGNEKTNSRIKGTQVQQGALVVVTDNKYPNVNLSGSAFVKSSTGKIVLGLDNYVSTINYFGTPNFYIRLALQIDYMDAAGSWFSQNSDIIIDRTASGLSLDRNYIVVKNVHALAVKILNFKDQAGTVITPPSWMPSNIFLDAEIETERFYSFSALGVLVANHFITTNNEAEVYWNNFPGAEEYELEYTYVNNISSASSAYNYATNANTSISAVSTNALQFTFNNNATRIRTTKNSAKISLNYDRGLIVYRVRAIGRSLANTDL